MSILIRSAEIAADCYNEKNFVPGDLHGDCGCLGWQGLSFVRSTMGGVGRQGLPRSVPA